MAFEKELNERSGGACELCAASGDMVAYTVEPTRSRGADDYVNCCSTCNEQLLDASKVDSNHWRCLNDSMWNEAEPVKVVAYRMLDQLKGEGWPQDLLDMIYLEDDSLKWAKEGLASEADPAIIHKDANGATINSGDSVVLIKDLNVKGANFIAKRGTAVRNVSLVFDNAEQIEGRVNGQHIVILTQYVKKT